AYEIVHRDVKPPNVMIEDGSGRIYLMDFGIAKQRGARGMTQDGSFVGTVDYASPEQVEGKEITMAADVYAFGGVLYECRTGQKPVIQLTPKAAAPTSNLPVPPSPLVGRDAELETVLALLRRDDSRLVTLSGLGGTGKTRLAIEAAHQLQDEVSSAFFVDLAPVREAQLVGSAIADVLGVREAPDKPIAQTIAERLGDEPTVLLLDNFEQ